MDTLLIVSDHHQGDKRHACQPHQHFASQNRASPFPKPSLKATMQRGGGRPGLVPSLLVTHLGTRRLHTGCPPFIVIIVNGYQVMALVDMGALLSTILWSVAEYVELTMVECTLPKIMGAHGSPITTHNVVIAQVCYPGGEIHHLNVVTDSQSDMIHLGIDFSGNAGCTIAMDGQTIWI